MALRARSLEHLEPGHAGQAEIEDQQVERLRGQGRIGFHAIRNVIDGIAGLAQRARQPVCQHIVIFGDKNPHDCLHLVAGHSRPPAAVPVGLAKHTVFIQYPTFRASYHER
jgi:hypothetical protein